MNKIARMIIVLTVIGLVSGGILAFVYNWALPKIEANQVRATDAAVFEVVPDTKSYKKIVKDELVYFQCFDKNKNNIGTAILCRGNGYQGEIVFMVGVNADLSKFTGMIILDQAETPGLGGRIAEKWFQNQFIGLATRPPVEYVKGKPSQKHEVQAIAGATISSKAIVDIINKTVKEWMGVR